MGWVFNDIAGIPRSSIEGVDRVIAGINREFAKMQNGTMAGLIKVAALVRNETEHGAVKTPVDYGNLRASWTVITASSAIISGGGRAHSPTGSFGNFTGPRGSQLAAEHAQALTQQRQRALLLASTTKSPFLIMGYSANYAMYVHENLGVVGYKTKDHPRGWSRKGSGPKWFEAALRKHTGSIRDIMVKNIKMVK